MKLNKDQNEALSKALFDVGKLSVGVLTLSPMGAPNIPLLMKLALGLIGCLITAGIFMWAIILLKGVE